MLKHDVGRIQNKPLWISALRVTLGELNNLQRKVYGRDLNGLKSNSGLKKHFGLTDILFALLGMRLLIQFENTFKSRANYSDSSHRHRFASINGFSRKISINMNRQVLHRFLLVGYTGKPFVKDVL